MGADDIDGVDFAILKMLSSNARVSIRKMARKLRLSASAVFTRMHRLEEKGVVKGYAPLLDTEKLGFGVTVAIAIKAKGGKLVEVEAELARRPNIVSVYDITGEYDILVIAKFRGMGELNKFVKNVLAMHHIEHTCTYTVLNTVKETPFPDMERLGL